MSNTRDTDDILAALDDDGDEYLMPDGRMLRLRIEADDQSGADFINDCDAYGRVAWCEYVRDTGHVRPRPEDFDGSAVILCDMHGDRFWWLPYREGHKLYDSPEERVIVRELVTFGPRSVVLELCEGRDHYGRPIVTNAASLGGCFDVADDGYRRSIVAELLAELLP